MSRLNLQRLSFFGTVFSREDCGDTAHRRYSDCNFNYCSFCGCDLALWEFSQCTFITCDFTGACLTGCEFRNNRVENCIFTGTCFDPKNIPNSPPGLSGTGFRTKHSIHMGGGEYVVGQTYEAPIFSTAGTTCHPGLYFFPTLSECINNYFPYALIEISYSPSDVHCAGGKYRTKKFTVVRDIPREETDFVFETNIIGRFKP